MKMGDMMGAAQNVWDSLDKLQQDDPAKYQVISNPYSMELIGIYLIYRTWLRNQWNGMKKQNPNLNHACVWKSRQRYSKWNQIKPSISTILLSKTNLTCYLNLLTWSAVAKPDYTSTHPSLPIAGGLQTFSMGHSVFRLVGLINYNLINWILPHSVCLHPSVLVNPDNSHVEEVEELENIASLVIKYCNQVHPSLHLQQSYRSAKSLLSIIRFIVCNHLINKPTYNRNIFHGFLIRCLSEKLYF